MTHEQLCELAQWLTRVVALNITANVGHIPHCPKGLCFNLVVHDPESNHSIVTSDGADFANVFGQRIASRYVRESFPLPLGDEPS